MRYKVETALLGHLRLYGTRSGKNIDEAVVKVISKHGLIGECRAISSILPLKPSYFGSDSTSFEEEIEDTQKCEGGKKRKKNEKFGVSKVLVTSIIRSPKKRREEFEENV